jgi:glycosyltransferase involved in cell wall biosynthesis
LTKDTVLTSAAGAEPRVALVHDWLTGMRGGEKVLEAIAARFPGAPIYTLVHVPGSLGGAFAGHPIHTSFLQRIPGVERHYRRLLPFFPAAVEDFDLGAYDLVISTSHCVAKGAVPAPGAVHVCYCHTPMRYAWDQEHTYFPRRRGWTARLRNLALTWLRTWDVATVPRVDLFLANSSFVAERIRRYYGREAEVVPPPVDVDFFTAAAAGDGAREGALVVSALAPYKRIDLAIAACERLGVELKIVGTGPEERRLRRLAGPSTEFLGRVEGARLRDLYRRAACFLQPGVEDFGIASVEALACAAPVVARGRGGILDIVEDGVHGVLYELPPGAGDAAEIDACGAAIDKSTRIGFNPKALIDRARAFSVESFNDRLCDCLARASRRPPSR